MDELIGEGAKAAGQILEASPSWIDSMFTSLDKWNLLPFSEFRKKNALDKAAIQRQLEIQQQEHQARIDLLNASIKANLDWREGAANLALEAAKRDIEQGVPAPEALKRHDPFLERSTAQLLIDTLEGQYARERIALYALDAASDSPNESIEEGKTSATWTSRFWECAKGVRDEEAMQHWGKLLANEVKRPGSISLKTLDILRTLDSADAKIFFQLSPYIINGLFIPGDEHIIRTITPYNMMTLESIGLILLKKRIIIQKGGCSDSTKFFRINFISKNEVSIDVIAITPSGKDLYQISPISKEDNRIGAINYIDILKNHGISATLLDLTN